MSAHRLFAVSDLHLGHAANREAIEAIRPRPNDWLILAGDVAERDRTEACPALGGLDLDQRLDAEQPARSGAHDLAAGVGKGARDLVDAERDRRHVAADEDARHAATSAAIRSSAAVSIRATGRPSTKALGPMAHRPRQ